MLSKLSSILAKKDKKYLLFLIFLTIIVSMIEVIGISAIMPFIAVASDFTIIQSNEKYSFIYNYLDFKTEISFVIAFGIGLIIFYLLRSSLNLLYQYLLHNFTQKQYSILSTRLFSNYMSLPYQIFSTKNTSVLTKSIINEAANLISLLSACLLIVSELFIVILIYALMLYINYQITIFLTILLLLNAIIMLKTVSKKIKYNGVVRVNAQKTFYEIMNKSFGNFKLLKLKFNKDTTVNDFKKSSLDYATSNTVYLAFNQIPRLFLEALSFIIVIVIILYLIIYTNNDISKHIATISLFIISLYRLMPSMNRIMSSYNNIMFYIQSLDIIHKNLILDIEISGKEQVLFKDIITLNRVSFSYEKSVSALNDINLSIKKGSKIGFIGKSGSGKSTLVDLIIGLNIPTKGELTVDNQLINNLNIQSWRKKIGYIPQNVYLFDGTVGDNIAFGLEYNNNKIDNILKKVKMYDFLMSKNGQDTKVGEGGTMLSGGQKQRIAIARALYMDPEILVLDEATSALDSRTEEEIIKEMYDISDNKTLIMIAHRLSTLDGCDKIYKLDNGELIE